MKRLKFKNNKLSFKKFNQIIFEDKTIKKQYGAIGRPVNWHKKKIKPYTKYPPSAPTYRHTNNCYYKGKLVNGKYEGLGTEMILEEGNHMEDVISFYRGYWKNGKKHGKGYWSNHYPLVGRTESLNAINPFYSVMEHLQYDAYYYDGYWKEDKKHGKGTFLDEEGIFEGEFRNNIKWKGVLKPTPIPDNVATFLLSPAKVDKEVIINNGKKESK